MIITAKELNNSKEQLIFDWNPTEIKDESGSINFANYNLLDRGEIVRPSGNGLRRVSWDGMFPGASRNNSAALAASWKSPGTYATKLRRWKRNGTVIKLTISGTSISNFTCYLSSYVATYSGGLGDLQYNLEWTEYRSIAVKIIKRKKAPKRPTKTYKTHTIKYGDTLWDIAIKYLESGIRYKEIYALNKRVMDAEAKRHGFSSANGGNYLWPGTKLKLPKK